MGAWRKSSYSSGSGGSCVETASAGGAVMVRDTTQNGNGPMLSFDAATWQTFIKSL